MKWIKSLGKGKTTLASRLVDILGEIWFIQTMRAAATYSIRVNADSHIARMRVVQRDLANRENGETMELCGCDCQRYPI